MDETVESSLIHFGLTESMATAEHVTASASYMDHDRGADFFLNGRPTHRASGRLLPRRILGARDHGTQTDPIPNPGGVKVRVTEAGTYYSSPNPAGRALHLGSRRERGSTIRRHGGQEARRRREGHHGRQVLRTSAGRRTSRRSPTS